LSGPFPVYAIRWHVVHVSFSRHSVANAEADEDADKDATAGEQRETGAAAAATPEKLEESSQTIAVGWHVDVASGDESPCGPK
jgi:hypothetical protein